MEPKIYIIWSTRKINLDDPWQKKWYLSQVLTHGRAEDIAELDWEEIKNNLNNLSLPPLIKKLWESYFDTKG